MLLFKINILQANLVTGFDSMQSFVTLQFYFHLKVLIILASSCRTN